MKALLLCAALSIVFRLALSTNCNTVPNYYGTLIFSTNAQATVSTSSSVNVACKPGYVSAYDLSKNSFTVYCNSNNGYWYYESTYTNSLSECLKKIDFCSSTSAPNQPFVVLPSYPVSTTIDSQIYVWCKAGKWGNFAGNGTYIVATCGSSSDGSTGVWQSNDYCASGLSLKSSALLVLLAATICLLLCRF